MPWGAAEFRMAIPPRQADWMNVDRHSEKARGIPTAERAEFYRSFHESILDVIKHIFGEDGTKAVLFHLRLDQNVLQPKECSDKLHSIFKEGALTIERLILKELLQRVGLPHEEAGDFNFERLVGLAEQTFLTRTLGREHDRR